MARPKSTDFLHNFRFHVTVNFNGGAQLGTQAPKPTAGFNSVTVPEATQEAVEYREGHFIYTQKYSGLPSISDITLTRGVALKDGTFWAWMRDVIEGNSEYRADVSIFHFHRDAKPATNSDPSQEAGPMATNVGTADKGFIEYKLFESFPIRHKVSSDLDATGSEVSIQELDLAVESFEIIDHS
jgi:phage tail-like protein